MPSKKSTSRTPSSSSIDSSSARPESKTQKHLEHTPTTTQKHLEHTPTYTQEQLTYNEYLEIPSLLNLQHPRSNPPQ
ncbi:MAG: hypothetical protein AAGJ35_11975, partial [Myxococcota bacterium]